MSEDYNKNQSNSGWRKRQITLHIEARNYRQEIEEQAVGEIHTPLYTAQIIQSYLEKDKLQPAQKKPQNCGTGYCSCIECLIKPTSTALQEYIFTQHHR